MDFRYKCWLQWLFSIAPYGVKLNYAFQKYFSKTLLSDDHFRQKVEIAHHHYLKFQKYHSLKNNSNRYYEFGAGWDLIIPIAMSLLGFEVYCIDKRRLITDELIHSTFNRFISYGNSNPFNYANSITLRNQRGNTLSYLKTAHNLHYHAPEIAENTRLDNNSIDFISSTVTLEYIPVKSIRSIMRDCYRILKPGGVFSMTIDYQDHWSFFDTGISIYNFLKYSPKEWKKYSPPNNYQNRLRHKDYMHIIKETGYEIMEEHVDNPTCEQIEQLKELKIHKKFQQYSFDELAVKSSQIVLRKAEYHVPEDAGERTTKDVHM